MAHFSESLCEEVIKSEGKCGLSRNEMVQMARFALRAIRNENPWRMDAIRYRLLRGTELEWAGFFADPVKWDAGAWVRLGSRWVNEKFDEAVDRAMSGTGLPSATQREP